MDGLSDDGIKLFGKFLQHCGEQQGLMTQKAIAEWVAEKSGIYIPISQMGTLLKGRWERSFNFNYLFAVLDSAILRFPESVEKGRLLEYNDVMEILRGRLNPFTGQRMGSNGARVT